MKDSNSSLDLLANHLVELSENNIVKYTRFEKKYTLTFPYLLLASPNTRVQF